MGKGDIIEFRSVAREQELRGTIRGLLGTVTWKSLRELVARAADRFDPRRWCIACARTNGGAS